MKFKALIEKLDWKGDIVELVREFEHDKFNPDLTYLFEEFIKTGKVNMEKLPMPLHAEIWNIDRKIAPPRSIYTFSDHESGLVAIIGEYYPTLSLQFVAYDKFRNISNKWIETDHDLTEGR